MEGYKNLANYIFTVVIHDLTVIFCRRFISKKLRTFDQMEQSTHSGKQNIAEGYSLQSLESYIKLLGVSFGSFKELASDYEDFLKQNQLPIWLKDDLRVKVFRDFRAVWKCLNLPKTQNLPNQPEAAANMLLTFCQMETYLFRQQINSLKRKFIKEGGSRENLFKKRIGFINKNKS